MEIIITLILVALVFFFFEIFVPGGILGAIGGLCLIGATVLTYIHYGLMPSLIVFFCSLVFVIFFFFFAINLLPKLPIGKKLILSDTQKGYHSNIEEADETIIGKQGKAITTMAPSGTVVIEGQRYEAASQSGMLAVDDPVVVVSKDSFKLVVRKAKEEEVQ